MIKYFKGKIRFDPSKSWDETPDSFSETTESRTGKLTQKETFLIAHDPGDDFVLNYGELTKAFKINPNIKDSFAKTANKHKEIGDNRKVTEVKNHFLKQRLVIARKIWDCDRGRDRFLKNLESGLESLFHNCGIMIGTDINFLIFWD